MPEAAFWRGRTVLVTGATGFLGGWLVRRLLEYRSRVIALVRRPRPESQFYLAGFDRQVRVADGGADDAAVIDRICAAHPIEVALHTAALSDVNRALDEPIECFRSTIESTWLLLEGLRAKRPDCVTVVSSSDKAYGPQAIPYREDRPLQPVHPYEVAKASQDLIAQSYGRVYGSPVAVTRCGNYFGGYDFNFERLIPGTIRSLLLGDRPVLRSDGRFTRDFLYVEDAVDAQLMLAERLARDPAIRGQAFNFSYQMDAQVIDIVTLIAGLMGSPLRPKIEDRSRSEISNMSLSAAKARSQLGWTARHGFEAGLQATITWYSEHLGGRS